MNFELLRNKIKQFKSAEEAILKHADVWSVWWKHYVVSSHIAEIAETALDVIDKGWNNRKEEFDETFDHLEQLIRKIEEENKKLIFEN